MQLSTLDLGLQERSGCPHLEAYLADIAASYCPYIVPARTAGTMSFMSWTPGELAEIGGGAPEAGLLLMGIAHAERVRRERRRYTEAGEAARGRLLCDNLVVLNTEDYTWRAAKDLIDWPHFILKNLYSEVGLMFGKFWTHEQTDSLDGRAIPEPPMTFLSIRSAVRVRDPKLLHEQGDFAALIETAHDDGRDVLAPVLGRSVFDGDILDVGALGELGAYDRLKQEFASTDG